MIRTFTCLALVLFIAACGVRDPDPDGTGTTSDSGTDSDSGSSGSSSQIPPNPDWSEQIPDEVSGLYSAEPNYLYISPGGYKAFFPLQSSLNCHTETEVELISHDGGEFYSSIDAYASDTLLAESHEYQITFQGDVMNLTEIITGGSSTSYYTIVTGLSIYDIPICSD